MKRILNWIIFFVLIGVLVAGVIYIIILITPDPPKKEVEGARIAISEARKSGAESYSPKTLGEAVTLYEEAMKGWKRENERFFLMRDFEKVTKNALEAQEKAKVAEDYSLKSSGSLKKSESEKINALRSRVRNEGPLFNRLPLPEGVKKSNARGKLLLGEAEIAYRKGDYLKARNLLVDAKDLLNESYDYANRYLVDYFKAYPDWIRWAERTIDESRKNRNYAIIVDKFGRKLYLYNSGVLKHTYDAELGKNWIGHKKVRGDLTTPEGRYKIVAKKEGRNTIYYKALLINYPSREDAVEFKREQNNGNLPGSASIGNLIEIHGEGGKGGDWTEGCVAMTNKDMDQLYRLVQNGTPVTIVGSLRKLDEILNQ